ncbi:MAG: hypothetical protein O7G83_20375 [Proteobacteria bacterium]|nr:hypothetical protein [Pseudomonadota bacterium]
MTALSLIPLTANAWADSETRALTTYTHTIFASQALMSVIEIPDVPDFGSIEGADWVCNDFAFTAGLMTDWNFIDLRWKAIMSVNFSVQTGTNVNAKDRFAIRGPIYNTAGELFAHDAASLYGDQPLRPVGYDEYGSAITTNPSVWTGTSSTGIQITGTCNAWSSPNPSKITTSGNATKISAWLAEGTRECNTNARIYCISPPEAADPPTPDAPTFRMATTATFVRATAPSSKRNTFTITLLQTDPVVRGAFTTQQCLLTGSPVDDATQVGNCQWTSFSDGGLDFLRFSFNFRLPGTSGTWGQFVLVNARGIGRFARFWRPQGSPARGTANGPVASDY